MNNEVVVFSGTAPQSIISTEVAEMLDTAHKSLIRKIEGINKDFTEHKIVPSEY